MDLRISSILVIYKAIFTASDISIHHGNEYLWSGYFMSGTVKWKTNVKNEITAKV